MSDLFLTTAVASGLAGAAEVTRWRLGGAAGTSSRLVNKNTTAAPASPLKVTDSATAGLDGNTLAWYSLPIQAVTIAGQIVCSLWTKESGNTANVAPSVGIYRCSATGAELATIVDPAVNLGPAEMATTAGGVADVVTVTAANVVDTAIATGELLKVALFIDNAVDQGGSGSMGSGANAQFWVNGPTGQAGQSRIAFTEVVVGVVPVVVDPVIPAQVGRPGLPIRAAASIIGPGD